MIQTVRQELLHVLTELSAACPEIRFGQLIANLSSLARGLSPEGLWDAEDEELLATARQQLEYFTNHRSNCRDPVSPQPSVAVPGSQVEKTS